MKKFLVVPIMVIYLLTVSGLMIHWHYCGDKLESWSLFSENNGCDDGGCDQEQEGPDDCCKDKVVRSQAGQEQHYSQAILLKAFSVFDALISPSHGFAPTVRLSIVPLSTAEPRGGAPPGLWQELPLYRLYARFTYYG